MTARPTLMPADTPDYMAPAWAGCMSWALGKAEVRQAFERETGMQYEPPRTGLDAAIDKTTDHGEVYVQAFIAWANLNVWGPVGG